jgi:hypothetical protein
MPSRGFPRSVPRDVSSPPFVSGLENPSGSRRLGRFFEQQFNAWKLNRQPSP